jgi:hypothetical protein
MPFLQDHFLRDTKRFGQSCDCLGVDLRRLRVAEVTTLRQTSVINRAEGATFWPSSPATATLCRDALRNHQALDGRSPGLPRSIFVLFPDFFPDFESTLV